MTADTQLINNRNLFFTVPEIGKSKTRYLQSLPNTFTVSGEDPLPGS